MGEEGGMSLSVPLFPKYLFVSNIVLFWYIVSVKRMIGEEDRMVGNLCIVLSLYGT